MGIFWHRITTTQVVQYHVIHSIAACMPENTFAIYFQYQSVSWPDRNRSFIQCLSIKRSRQNAWRFCLRTLPSYYAFTQLIVLLFHFIFMQHNYHFSHSFARSTVVTGIFSLTRIHYTHAHCSSDSLASGVGCGMRDNSSRQVKFATERIWSNFIRKMSIYLLANL